LLQHLRREQRRHWQEGQPVSVEEYLGRYPELQADPEGVVDLIYGESLLGVEFGAAISEDDYCRRFPEFAETLRRQLAVDRMLREGWLEDGDGWVSLETVTLAPDESGRDLAAGTAGPEATSV